EVSAAPQTRNQPSQPPRSPRLLRVSPSSASPRDTEPRAWRGTGRETAPRSPENRVLRALSPSRSVRAALIFVHMFGVDRLILVGAVLVLIGIASSKLSSRMGLPVLVLFLGVGLLAGSEGIGGIEFDNYVIAHGVGTIALAIILFDGGLRTSASSLRQALGPAVVLASAGV